MPSSNRRSRSRVQINLDATLVDQQSGKQMGKVVNMHQEGMMIIAHSDVVEEDKLYQANLVVNQPGEGFKEIPLGLDCMWRKKLEHGIGYWAGFRIISASKEAMEEITTLIEVFGEPGGDSASQSP